MGSAISRLAEVEEIGADDVIIAAVGQTAAGKSSFINKAAGRDILPVNHRLRPEPAEVQHVECSNPERYPDRRVVFVDTPAFDSEKDEKSVEKKLKRWLKRFSSKRVRITGILYLHRITDTKLSDPPARHLALLKSLYEGSMGGFPDRVMMVTTMWGVLQSHETGLKREEELQKYWDTLPKASVVSRIMRFENTFDSAWSIVFALLKDGDTRVYERIEREEREGTERVVRERIERERRERLKREEHEALEGVERGAEEHQRIEVAATGLESEVQERIEPYKELGRKKGLREEEQRRRKAEEHQQTDKEEQERKTRKEKERIERERYKQIEREGRERREREEREAKGREEHEAKKQAERKARERQEREKLEREMHERIQRERDEQIKREGQERREKEEREAKRREEHEAKEQAEHEARERQERDKLEREMREGIQRERDEQIEREGRERREREEREAKRREEHKAKEQAEREARERQERDKLEREMRERIQREMYEQIEREGRERREKEEREAKRREEHEAKEQAEREVRERQEREKREREMRKRRAKEMKEQCCRLLPDLLGHRTSRNMLATYFRLGDAEERAKEELAQAMVDFLSQVLDENTLSGPGDRRIALQLLARITKSAQVVSKCLELTGVQCDFREKDGGGHGVIYQGTFEGQTICIKAVRFYLKSENRTALRAHAGEFTLCAHISHPNIQPFYGLFHSNEPKSRVCIVSPWMEHGNLAEYVHSSPPPSLELRTLFLFDIICGLKYLHNEEIIHGDLKANNVLVISSLRAVLTDLGASRIIVSTPSTATAAEYQSTPYWMAPELLTSEEKAQPTKESDMWAFGCTCYEVLKGEIPFVEHKKIAQLIVAFQKGERLDIPQSSSGDKSSIIWPLVQRCCEYDVKKRPSADEAARSLATLVANPPPFDLGWTQLLANLKEKRETRSDKVIIDYDPVHEVLLTIQMASRAKAENQTPPPPTVNPTADGTKEAHTLKPVDQSLCSKFKQWFCFCCT